MRNRCFVLLLLLLAFGCSARTTIHTQEEVDRLPVEQQRTMEIIRDIAIAMESYSIDHDSYPGPFDGFVGIEYLESSLVPDYIESLPTVDGWGGDLLVWSDGSEYAIVSLGGDGAGDRDYSDLVTTPRDLMESAICAGATSNPEDDVVLMGGAFCQWPAFS